MKRDRSFDYKLESELCTDFAAWARKYGWTVYAETEGWDLLLVDKEGRQLGIEAKLTLNPKVIQQAIGDGGGYYYGVDFGPDHRGVLVPEPGPLASIAQFLGLEVFYGQRTGYRPWRSLEETEPTFRAPHFNRLTRMRFREDSTDGMFDWNPGKRHELPAYVNEQPGGRPGPIQLTHWKVGALRVMAMLEVRGWVTRKDVRECGCDPRRFCASDGWLTPLGEDRWSIGTLPRFDQQHPTNYALIVAETREKYPPPDASVLTSEQT